MSELTTASKQPPNRWGKFIIIVIVALVGLDACFELTMLEIGEHGPPITERGTIVLDEPPVTDSEFVTAGIASLREIGWWQNDPYLQGFSRSMACSLVLSPPRQRLLHFRRADRITLFVYTDHVGTIEFNGNVLRYQLEDFGWEEKTNIPSLDLASVQIDSDEALRQAELHGGEAVRSQLNVDTGNCFISMSLSDKGYWKVDYLSTYSYDPLLCLNVDIHTGKVTQVAERSFKPCRYYTP